MKPGKETDRKMKGKDGIDIPGDFSDFIRKEFVFPPEGVGLHLRTASRISSMAGKYPGVKIFLINEKGDAAVATSTLNLLSLGVEKGSKVTLAVGTEDEDVAESIFRDFEKILEIERIEGLQEKKNGRM